MSRWLLVVAMCAHACSMVVGCRVDLDRRRPEAEIGVPDAVTDRGSNDVPVVKDRGTDKAKPLQDGPPPQDGPPLQDGPPPPDQKPPLDQQPTPDLPSPNEASLPAPCSGTSFEIKIGGWNNMHICNATGATVNQAQAQILCGPGWHMCTGTEYKARGGVTTATVVAAWIAVCMVHTNAPTDGICAGWSSGCMSGCTMMWECLTGTAKLFLGTTQWAAMTSSDCYRIGQNVQSNEAFWQASRPDAGNTMKAAVCCN